MRHPRHPLTPPRSHSAVRRCAGLSVLVVLAHDQVGWLLGWLVTGVFVTGLLVASVFQ